MAFRLQRVRNLPGAGTTAVTTDPFVDEDGRDPDIAAFSGKLFQKKQECAALFVSRKGDCNMIARTQPLVRANCSLCLCLSICQEMLPAEMLSRIRLKNDRLSSALVALHSSFPIDSR